MGYPELPTEIVSEILDYANFICCLCEKKLNPATAIGCSGFWMCSNAECYYEFPSTSPLDECA